MGDLSYQVFVCHSSHDRPAVQTLVSSLEEAGVPCWVAPRDIDPGAEWSAAIIQALRHCSVLLLVLTGASNDSPQVLREVERAVSLRRTIFTLHLEDVPLSPSLEYFISVSHWFEAQEGPLTQYLPSLIERVRGCLSAVQKETAHEAETSLERFADKRREALLSSAVYPTPASVALPSGQVTFLMTDIEGSTRLWEKHFLAMPAVLARHEDIADAIVREHSGVLLRYKGEGDSLFTVFARAQDAVAAACALQIAFHKEAWPAGMDLRVRMALHTGECAPRDADYFGRPVNRCARIRTIANGGQILLSEATRDLVQGSLPAGGTLRDLGRHRLRDLEQAEQVYQLLHPDLPDQANPLLSLEAIPNNLPQHLTSFIGREQDIQQVKHRLSSARLVTVTGAGGCGKSRLGLQVAAEMLESYPEGVWWVDLARTTDPVLVAHAVAAVVGGGEQQSDTPVLEALAKHLKTRRTLLILDNCEHLLQSCASFAESLLHACPLLTILASSREMLGVPGENLHRIRSLSLPDPARLPPSGAEAGVSRYEAVQLFAERAAATAPGFALTSANAFAVAQVCHRLDGIPLAIELAAARVKAMPVEQLARRLDDRFRLLTSGNRTALPRQQTLKALVDWSYDLLTDPERLLLSRLSVFLGGWTLEAAETVCADAKESDEGIAEWQILDLLTSLVDKSLVIYEEEPDELESGEARYRLLGTVRQYAAERLQDSGRSEGIQRRHCEYYLAMTGRIAAVLAAEEERARRVRLFEADGGNIHQALEYGLNRPDCIEAVLRAIRCLFWFWTTRGFVGMGRQLCEKARRQLQGTEHADAFFELTLSAAITAQAQADYSAGRVLFEEALTRAKQTEDPDLRQSREAIVLLNQGYLEIGMIDFPAAASCFERALALFRQLDAQRVSTSALCEASGYVIGSLLGVAHVARFMGDLTRAQGLYEQALELYRQAASVDEYGVAHCLLNLGHVLRCSGDFDRAGACYEQSLSRFVEIADRVSSILCIEGMACLAADRACAALSFEVEAPEASQHAERSLRLFGAADAMRRAAQAPPSPADRAPCEMALSAARALLTTEVAEAAWTDGVVMTADQAVAQAVEVGKGGSDSPVALTAAAA